MEPLQPLLPSPCEEEEVPLDEGKSLNSCQTLPIFIIKHMEKMCVTDAGIWEKSSNFH